MPYIQEEHIRKSSVLLLEEPGLCSTIMTVLQSESILPALMRHLKAVNG